MAESDSFSHFMKNVGFIRRLYSEYTTSKNMYGRHDTSLSTEDTRSSTSDSDSKSKYYMITIYAKKGSFVNRDLSEEESDMFHEELGIVADKNLNIAWANFVKDGRYVVACSDSFTEMWLLENTSIFTNGKLGAIPSNKYYLIHKLKLWKVLIPRYLIEDDPEALISKIFKYNGLFPSYELVDFVYPEESGKKELELVLFMDDETEGELKEFAGRPRYDYKFKIKYSIYWLTFRRMIVDKDEDSESFPRK